MRHGLKLLLVACLLLVGQQNSFASDLGIIAVYACDAQEVYEAFKNECLVQHPHQSDQVIHAWESWKKRNESDAKKMKAQCKEQFERQGESPQQKEYIRQKMSQLKSDLIRSYPVIIKSQGERYCIEVFESSDNDLNQFQDK